jgi:heptosyltransferase-1
MKILLVKLSSLGDVVHTLPVVHDILAAMPDATIDWVVEKAFAPVLLPCAGLRKVIPCEIRRWRKAPFSAVTRQEMSAFKAQLRDQAYDAVIDLQGLSKSAVVARLARMAPEGKRYALANQTDGSGYEAPSRWVADVAIRIEPRTHAVQRSRELAARALAYDFAPTPDFGLKVPLAQGLAAHDAIDKLARRVAFVHGTSRADKQWPSGHWVELGQRLSGSGFDIALLHGNAPELARSHQIAEAINAGYGRSVASVLPPLPLNQVVAELAACASVIGVDSGVSHIAVALDLPHVQIYNFDTAWRTGPVGGTRQVSVFAESTPTVDSVWSAWLTCSGSALAASAGAGA